MAYISHRGFVSTASATLLHQKRGDASMWTVEKSIKTELYLTRARAKSKAKKGKNTDTCGISGLVRWRCCGHELYGFMRPVFSAAAAMPLLLSYSITTGCPCKVIQVHSVIELLILALSFCIHSALILGIFDKWFFDQSRIIFWLFWFNLLQNREISFDLMYF